MSWTPALSPAGQRAGFKEPLRISDGHHEYLLKFDCEECKMSVIFVRKKKRATN